MSSRKEKLTFFRLLLLMGAVIWLPLLLKSLAGIGDLEDEAIVKTYRAESPQMAHQKTPEFSDTAPPLKIQRETGRLAELKPISNTSTEPQTETAEFFDLDKVRPAPSELELTATLVSPMGKTAIINQRAFSEGEQISVGQYPLRIRSILPGRVILERDGGLYELKEKRALTEFFFKD